MSPTRREIALMAAATALTPTLAAAARLKPLPSPLVIAHRGASGERPEETRLAYELAIDEGADFIEPDLEITKDGVLVARHENEISSTTDVGRHPEFAARKTTKSIDGEEVHGWFIEDFTLEELKSLRCRERLPQFRPGSAAYDGLAPILTFQEVIDIAKAGERRTGRTIGVYPEMKHPTFFAGIGLPLEHRLHEILRRNGYTTPTSAVFVQCFEVTALKTFAKLSRVQRVQLLGAAGGPFDLPNARYADMITPSGLKDLRSYVDAIGPDQSMVLDMKALPGPVPTPLVADAHAAGLKVHSWTARKENFFLPKSLQRGDSKSPGFLAAEGDIDALLTALFASGLDGAFSDYSALAFKARAEVMARKS